jgi:hypothetical protein
MPVTLDRFETGKILAGEATAISRLYDKDGGCPHAPGTVVMLASPHAPPLPGATFGPEVPVARATITTVDRTGLGERRQDDRKAILEGFEHSRAWYVHFQQMYGPMNDMTPVHRLTLRIDEIFKA